MDTLDGAYRWYSLPYNHRYDHDHADFALRFLKSSSAAGARLWCVYAVLGECAVSVRHGVDVRRLQQVLGRSNINTTAVYLRFNDQDLQDVYANVPS